MTQTTQTRAAPTPETALEARRIPALGHAEAMTLATEELSRLLALVELLAPEDWTRPTACTRWTVREVVAHLVGASATIVAGAAFARAYSPRRQRPYRRQGFSLLDATNQIPVDERMSRSPDTLIQELRTVGPRAIARRGCLPVGVRGLRLPLGLVYPELRRTWVSLGYMTNTILVRDAWMHRLDLARATGREMVQTPAHDQRITALVVRDVAQTLRHRFHGASVLYELRGPAGGTWRINSGDQRAASLVMDALDFHWLASGRLSLQDARAMVTLKGDRQVAESVLAHTTVPY